MVKFVPLLDRIRHKIDRAKTVSFDIFDTLLLRPYLRPADLFLHIEKAKKMSCFCSCRCEAEVEARRKNPAREDITFDQIYDEIDDIFKPLKQTELDWEMRVLARNPEMKAVWDYAKGRGKKIVVATDMYLPKAFVAKVLKKNGFGGYDGLYVSGELGKTKAAGTMYRHILDELRIPPGEMLHIGDNKKSDYENPRKLNIPAVRYYQVSRRFTEANPRARDFANHAAGNLGASILMAVLAMRWQKRMLDGEKPRYFSGIGYEYAGPVIYGYTRWIEHEAKKAGLDNLLFVARDGYTLQKVFDSFKSGVKSHYIYAPRFLNLICRLDYARKDKKQSNAIIEYFERKDGKIKELADAAGIRQFQPGSFFWRDKFGYWSELHEFIQSNKDLFVRHAVEEHLLYKKYLDKAVSDKSAKIGIVDTITGEFSSQKLIQNTLGVPTVGFYWSVIKVRFQGVYFHKKFLRNTFDGWSDEIFTKNWNFMEFLITAPEYPIKRIDADGKPVYDDNPGEVERTRKEVAPLVSGGAVEFARDISRIFGGENIFLDANVLVSWINCFCDSPTRTDMTEMAAIKHSSDSDHKEYAPLFSTRIPFWQAIRHPKRAKKLARAAVWNTTLQNIGLNIMSPFHLQMHGIRHLGFHFLPRLKKRFFTFRIRFTPKCYYDVMVGMEQKKD
ncbi:MAG: HAD-IA family hydrolase [Rickettsiales bacterium]|jgi:HAD superfamily hydrolase (TIGR01549 family)|nr:HAD-IA family hydrolase [Rickettsiales bacterium]